MNESDIAMLQEMPVFGGIRSDVLSGVLERCRLVIRGPGQDFFRENDPGSSFYVLLAGRVEVRKSAHDGVISLGELRRGDCFGEMSLIDLGPRSATVRALDECTAVELDWGSLQTLAETDMEQFSLLQMNVARELSRRLRAADRRYLDARARSG